MMTQARLKQKSPIRMDFIVKPDPRQGRSMKSSASPHRLGKKSSSDSRPQRNKSSNSHISKDDVMPCYKAQFRPNPATVSQTAKAKPVVSEILSQYLLQTQNSPISQYPNSSQLSVLEAPRDHRNHRDQVASALMQNSRNSHLDQS